jgi:hypothetical protein
MVSRESATSQGCSSVRPMVSRESATSQGCSSVRPASIATDAKSRASLQPHKDAPPSDLRRLQPTQNNLFLTRRRRRKGVSLPSRANALPNDREKTWATKNQRLGEKFQLPLVPSMDVGQPLQPGLPQSPPQRDRGRRVSAREGLQAQTRLDRPLRPRCPTLPVQGQVPRLWSRASLQPHKDAPPSDLWSRASLQPHKDAPPSDLRRLQPTQNLARVCNLTRMLLRQTCVDCNRRKITYFLLEEEEEKE